MKKEISAGGVIFRQKAQKLEVLLLKDMNDNWTFPKGIIEAGETPQTAAIREIKEETGVTNLVFHHELPAIHYIYKRGELIDKTVYYFLFTSTIEQELVPQTEEGISELHWYSLEDAKKIIGYPQTNLSLLSEVQKLL